MIFHTVDIDSAVEIGELLQPCLFCKRLAAYRHWQCGRKIFLCHLCYVGLRKLGKIVSFLGDGGMVAYAMQLDDNIESPK
jgi:hypothetical protein